VSAEPVSNHAIVPYAPIKIKLPHVGVLPFYPPFRAMRDHRRFAGKPLAARVPTRPPLERTAAHR
jgi:hypothetical protein